MEVHLTERARKYLWRETSRRSYSSLVPALVWGAESHGPTRYFWGLFTDSRVTHRHGWFCWFYGPDQRPKDWITDIGGLRISVSPQMRERLTGKTLDFQDGQLKEL